MRTLIVVFAAVLALAACAQTHQAQVKAPSVPWYQRTTSKIMGFVRHEDVVDGRARRFGCLFTHSSVTVDQDALMCFEPETHHAAIWLVGLRPTDCDSHGCVVAIESAQKNSKTLRLPLEIVPHGKAVYGLYSKGTTQLYDTVAAAGHEYILKTRTDKGEKAFSFNIPEPYRN